MSPGRRSRNAARLRLLLRQLPRPRSTGAIKNAYRLGLLVSAAILVEFAFPVQSAPDLPVLEEGMVASEDVIAPINFGVEKSQAELTRERNEVANAVLPVFDFRPDNADSVVAAANAFFVSLDSALTGVGGPDEAQGTVASVLEGYRMPVVENASLLATAPVRQRIRAELVRQLRNLSAGVANASDLGSAGTAAVMVRGDGEDRVIPRDSINTMQQFLQGAGGRAAARLTGPEHSLFQFLLIRFSSSSRPTLTLNAQATEAARDQARQAVSPLKYEVLEGERIVGAHERVGSEGIERLNALRAELASRDGGRTWGFQLGGLVYDLLLLLVLGLVLRHFRPQIYSSNRSMTLIWVVVLAVAGAAALTWRSGASTNLIPIAFAALLVATLYDGLLALVTVFVLVALTAARPPLIAMTVLFPMMMGGAAAALSGRVVQRRAHTLVSAGIIAGAYVLSAVSLALINRLGLDWVLAASFWGSVNGISCAVLAAGVLPLAESFTRLTTEQTLLELADLNRPLLRRLSLEAPGTYAHSINVANLAEAAAREVGANSLLVRVGTYYHDIGKVRKPQYFVENQPRGRNPHDKLKPATSAGIVREHVKDGLELAEEARLPEVVKAFIREHHGTQRIGFFWEKAKQLEPEGDLDSNDFRYPGPKPQSKETAILLMADSVESAARVLQDASERGIEELVGRIVDFKMSEKQLDEAPLTLRQIGLIKQQFVKVLSGMYHSRIDYPQQNNERQEAKEPVARGTS